MKKRGFFTEYAKRGVTALCALSFVFTLAYAPQSPATSKVHAQIVSFDPITELQTTLKHTWDSLLKINLDQIVLTASKMAIQSLTKSITNWIRGGFKGSPAFVTDLNKHMLQLADSSAGDFIRDTYDTDFFCSPFKLDLAAALDVRYFSATSKSGFFKANTCTLTDMLHNVANAGRSVDDFYQKFVDDGDFTIGGWPAWFEVAVKPQNNVYGAYFAASPHLNASIVNEKGRQLNILDWGKGFLSWCPKATQSTDDGDAATLKNDSILCKDKDGKKAPTQTPGSVIEKQLEQTLGSGVRQLELADSFNEIVSAAATTLIDETVRGAQGLLGISSAPSYTRPTTFINGGYGTSAADQAGKKIREESEASRAAKGLVKIISQKRDQLDEYNANWETIINNARSVKNMTTTPTPSQMADIGSGDWACGKDDENRHAPEYARYYIDGAIRVFDVDPFLALSDKEDENYAPNAPNPFAKGQNAIEQYIDPYLKHAVGLQDASDKADTAKERIAFAKDNRSTQSIDKPAVDAAIRALVSPALPEGRIDALGLFEKAEGWRYSLMPILPSTNSRISLSLPAAYTDDDLDFLSDVAASTTLAISSAVGTLSKRFDLISNDQKIMPSDAEIAKASMESQPGGGGGIASFGQRVSSYSLLVGDNDHRCGPVWDSTLRPYLGRLISNPPETANIKTEAERLKYETDVAAYALAITESLYNYGGTSLDAAWTTSGVRLPLSVDRWLRVVLAREDVQKWLLNMFSTPESQKKIDNVNALNRLAITSNENALIPGFLKNESIMPYPEGTNMDGSGFITTDFSKGYGYGLPDRRNIRIWLIWQFLKTQGPTCKSFAPVPTSAFTGGSISLGWTTLKASSVSITENQITYGSDATDPNKQVKKLTLVQTFDSLAVNGNQDVTFSTAGEFEFKLTATDANGATTICSVNVPITAP